MALDSTLSTRTNYLRTPSPSHSITALERHQQPVASLFGDVVVGSDHNHDQGQYQYQNPQHQHQPPPLKSQPLPPQPYQQQQQPRDSADWDTRAKILLVEVTVVTVIVGTVLFFCLRKHHRRLVRGQQTFTARQMQAMQEWTTIRPGNGGAQPTVFVRGRSAAAIGGEDDGRVRADGEARGGMISLRPSAGGSGAVDGVVGEPVSVLSATAAARRDPDEPEVDDNADRTAPLRRLLSVPRMIGAAILYPLRMIEAGVNGWATENYDEAFLRNFMERLEAEREAAREDPDDREIRLRDAFAKECMVWKLDDAHFLPPKKLGDENLKHSCPLCHGVEKILDDDIGNEQHARDPYNLGKSNEEDNLQYAEEGKVDGTYVRGTHFLEHARDVEGVEREGSAKALREETYANPLDVVPEVPVVCNLNPEDCQDTPEETPAIYENCLAANNGPGAMEHLALPAIQHVTGSTATVSDQPTSPSSVLVAGGTSAGTLHSCVPPANIATNAMAKDSFDEDAAPEYLYLDTHRRRANTCGSLPTSISSSGHSASSSAESMEYVSSVAGEASQDSHRIPNQCAICLCDYEKGDTIVTSFNGDCPHAFHQECIVEWLVKMQDGTPCPCCRQTFVELDELIPGASSGGVNTTMMGNNNNNESTANSNAPNNHAGATEQDDQEAERLRQERRRRRIELGIQRGRAFNASVISLRNNHAAVNVPNAPQDREEAERVRQLRERRNIELGLRRGGRAFNTSAISLR